MGGGRLWYLGDVVIFNGERRGMVRQNFYVSIHDVLEPLLIA